MVHVLETGLEFIAQENPNGKPAVRGYNIINGELTLASDGATFTGSALFPDNQRIKVGGDASNPDLQI